MYQIVSILDVGKVVKTRQTDGERRVLFGDEGDFWNKCKQQCHPKTNIHIHSYHNSGMGKCSKLEGGGAKEGKFIKGREEGWIEKMQTSEIKSQNESKYQTLFKSNNGKLFKSGLQD